MAVKITNWCRVTKALLVAAALLNVSPVRAKSVEAIKRGSLKKEAVNSGTNIFSTGGTASGGIGEFKQPPKTEQAKLPSYQQVRVLPSLTAAQRKDVTKINEESKKTIQDLQEKIKELQTRGQKLDAVESNRDAIQTLKDHIQAERLQAWTLTKALLTEQQLIELEKMRRGELLPVIGPITPVGQENDSTKK